MRPSVFSRRQLILGAACGLLGAAIGARAWWVNQTAVAKPPTATHEMGEWVALDGAFVFNVQECTDGYSVAVEHAEILSYNDYVRRHATDPSIAVEGADVPSIVCLTVCVRNDASDPYGCLFVGGMTLVPDRKNEYFVLDSDLLVASEPAMQASGNPGFSISITPQTEYTVHLAYATNNTTAVEVAGGTTTLGMMTPMQDTAFEWVVSNAPTRHVVRIRLDA